MHRRQNGHLAQHLGWVNRLVRLSTASLQHRRQRRPHRQAGEGVCVKPEAVWSLDLTGAKLFCAGLHELAGESSLRPTPQRRTQPAFRYRFPRPHLASAAAAISLTQIKRGRSPRSSQKARRISNPNTRKAPTASRQSEALLCRLDPIVATAGRSWGQSPDGPRCDQCAHAPADGWHPTVG
jgi:hypothetical protein